MSAAQGKDAGLCGLSLRHWALSTSCASAIYFAIMTVLAIWARWTVGNLAFAVEQEGSKTVAWSSPKLVGIILAVTFALLALVSAYLAFRVYSKPEDNLNSITRTWHVLLVAVVLGSFCCIAGAVMAFGSAKSDIEAGCKAIDTQCFATYEVIQWVSIFFEVAGVALLIATLFTVRHYRHDLGSSSSTDGDTAKSKQSLLGSASNKGDPGLSYSLRPSDRSSRKKRGSRRAELGEYSMKKGSRRSRRDEFDDLYDKPRGRSRSRSRSRLDRDAVDELRRMEEKTEAAMRSLSRFRHRSTSRSSRRRSKSRASSSSEGEIERSINKSRRSSRTRTTSKSRSRSRSRRNSVSSASSDSSGDGRRRSGSRSRRRSY